MSFNADNPRRTERSLQRQRWACTSALAALAALLSSAAGCALDGMRPMSSVGVPVADRGTCEGLYVQSIWKGEDLSGPECASYGSAAGPDGREHEPEYDRRRVQKVCEQTQMRTILSGEASTRFTLQACAPHEPRYQQARL